MERFFVIILQTNLFLFPCSVPTQDIGTKNSSATPLMTHPWFHSSDMRDIKFLRQGLSPDGAGLEEKSELPPTKRDCVCSKIYDPVCASNNESYFNLCFLECKVPNANNITVVHQGNCIPFKR